MAGPVNPILLYHPDGYRMERQDIKGRNAAGEGFLAAFLAQTTQSDVFALCENAEFFKDFSDVVGTCGRPLQPRHVTRMDSAAFGRQGLLNLPDPRVAEEARIRNFQDDTAYALCGVTHSISSRGVLESIADLAVAPVMPWDAIVMTSRAAEAACAAVLDLAEEHLRNRIGATRFTRPMMPVIPLGTDARLFARNETDRKRWRSQLGLADDTIAVLFFGRLSVHAKASPFQLAQAVEIAARGGERYAIIWCGQFSNDFQRRVFMETAKAMAPSAAFHHVDGMVPNVRFSIWSAADIFCSLSDNIQETFGLAVIEAMAAELPVLASNWDGYRDTVQEGAGVLIDTYMTGDSMVDQAYRYASGLDSYDRFIGSLSQFCFVDVEQTAQWISRLGKDPELRRKFGAAARRRVEAEFDWKVVLPRYQELWNAQYEALEKARRDGVKSSPQHRILDPTRVFAGFASHRLEWNTPLAPGPLFDRWDAIINEPGIVLHQAMLLGRQDYFGIRDQFSKHATRTADELVAGSVPERRAAIFRSLHWLIKIGLLRMTLQQ